ncbi:hypothetical protein GEMRC1_008912 [Eukaryota sp. GEM-RC1]
MPYFKPLCGSELKVKFKFYTPPSDHPMSDSVDDYDYFSPNESPTNEYEHVNPIPFELNRFDNIEENFITVACLNPVEDKIMNSREEVLRFVSFYAPDSPSGNIHFEYIPPTPLPSVGFCGPQDGLLDFLSRNSPSCYHFFKSVSPSPGLYLALDDDQLTFILWPGDLLFSPQSSPIITFLRLLFEFCSDIFFVLPESPDLNDTPRRIGRSFTPITKELVPDDFRIDNIRTFGFPNSSDPLLDVHYRLSPNGTMFGVMEKSNVSEPKKIQNTELFQMIDHFRVSFGTLSDEEVTDVLAELYKSISYATNTSSHELKGILEQFFKNESELDTELSDCRNEIQEQSNEKHDLEETMRLEVTEFVQRLTLLERSVSEISFNPTCSICKDPNCVHRFTCCKNCVCTSCGELFSNDVCPLCLVSPCLGIETGPSLQEEQFNQSRVNLQRSIENMKRLTGVSELKRDILSQVLGSPNNDVNSIVADSVDRHYEPLLAVLLEREDELVDESQSMLETVREDVEELLLRESGKPLLVCSDFAYPLLNCQELMGYSLTFSQLLSSSVDASRLSNLISDDEFVSKIVVPRVDSTYKVINFFTDEDFVLLILSTSTSTKFGLLNSDPDHFQEIFMEDDQKRTVLADFDPITKTLVIYWMENSDHLLSTFIIDHTARQFVQPQKTINLSESGRYHDSLLQSGDPVLLKLALYSEGSKVVALDTTSDFVFADFKYLTFDDTDIPLPQEIDRDSLWIRSIKSNLLLMIYKNMIHGHFLSEFFPHLIAEMVIFFIL